jgi:hypothetical protein
MSMAEVFHHRCPTCEELRVGFTYRTLINGLCTRHALEQASGSFVKLTWRDQVGRNRDDYGFLRWYPIRDEINMVRYVRKVSDIGARVVRERSHNVVNIEADVRVGLSAHARGARRALRGAALRSHLWRAHHPDGPDSRARAIPRCHQDLRAMEAGLRRATEHALPLGTTINSSQANPTERKHDQHGYT